MDAYRASRNAQQSVKYVENLLFRGHSDVVEDDFADYFGSIPHTDLHFFFQAEDVIRDKLVTGVQTCALPIAPGGSAWLVDEYPEESTSPIHHWMAARSRSEERRVGKECRSWWSPYH